MIEKKILFWKIWEIEWKIEREHWKTAINDFDDNFKPKALKYIGKKGAK